MALHGNQKKFDKNGDGRLSAGEWQRWYSATYSHGIEMSERRKQAQAEDDWSSQLAQSTRTIRCAANSFVRAACAILPSTQPDAKDLAWRTLLCQITTALAEGNRWLIRQTISPSGMYVSGKAGYPYRVWAYDLVEICGLCSQKDFEQAVRSRRALFESVGVLTAERCGSFWQQVIAKLPPYDETSRPSFADGAVCSLVFAPDSDPAMERALEDLLQSLFPLAAFFADEMDAADRRDNRFLEYFVAHWRRLRGVYVPFCDDEVERLAEEFPQLKAQWTLEKLAKMDCADLLDELYRAEPKLALTIWRSLAETTEPITDPEAAEQFFYRLETVLYDGEDDPELLRPLLDALREEAFVRQMFQSAFVNFFHENLINAALVCGKCKQAEHFRELLNGNPLPRGRWELSDADLEKLFMPKENGEFACAAPATPVAAEDDPPDDGTVFHYCTVHVSGVRRPYAYLTGDLSLKVGDWVEVPFGKDDIPRRGQVSSLTVCTRVTAPWPPEQTKTVLRVVEAPVEAEKTPEQATRPASVSKPKPTRKKPEPKAAPEPAPTSEAPPVPAPATSGEDAEMARLLEEIEAEKEREKVAPEKSESIPVTVPKRSFPWKLACGGIAILACVIAGAASYRSDMAHYQQAEQYLAENDFQSAAMELSRVPSFYQDQESLARYAELCLLAESGTETASKTALDGLETLLASSDEAMCAQIQLQYERIHKQYNDLLYETALRHLQNKSYTKALNYLRKVPSEYPDTAELQLYAHSRANAKNSDTSYHLQTVLSAMEQIPADYSGTFAEEISAFRERLSEMIVASEAREEKIRAEREVAQAAAKKAEEERIAALKASGIPYVGMAERDVNSTRQLGKAAYNDQSSREWVKGADGKYFYDTKRVYAWYSKQNGDMVFKVECKNGVVISAVKYGGDAYWNGDQLLVKLGPQIIHKFNSGGTTNSGSDSSIRDVYDNPEDLYEENRDWFDDEDEAWDYWYED